MREQHHGGDLLILLLLVLNIGLEGRHALEAEQVAVAGLGLDLQCNNSVTTV
jgi:hypothetical protein